MKSRGLTLSLKALFESIYQKNSANSLAYILNLIVLMNLYFASLIVDKKGRKGEFDDKEFSLNWSDVKILGRSLSVAKLFPSFEMPGFLIT